MRNDTPDLPAAGWRTIELWSLSAADQFAANDPGLISCVPLTNFAEPPKQIITECRCRIDEQAPADEHENLLAVTQVLGRLKFDDEMLKIPGGRKNMLELPVTVDSSTPACGRSAARDVPNLTHHRLMLGISAAVVALAFLLEVHPEGRVAFRGLSEHPLPHTCVSRMWFGVGCPGCGLTRSFIYLARGDFAAAWALHPCGWILALATIAQFPYRIVVLTRGGRRPWPREWSVWFGYGLVALLLATWLTRTVMPLV